MSAVSIDTIKVYGTCCWKLEERYERWSEMFEYYAHRSGLNRYIYKGEKYLCPENYNY